MNRLLTSCVVVALAAPVRAQTPEELLALGIKQVEEGDFPVAVITLEEVVRLLSADETKSKDLARAYLFTAIAYVGLSQEAAAKAKFQEARRHDVALTLSPREFPPRVIQAFEQAIRELRDLPLAPEGVASFVDAAKRDDMAELRRLLQRTPGLLSAREPEFGASALHWATLRGHTVAVAFLVGAGADLTVTNNSGETPADVARRAKKKDLFPWLQSPGVGLPPGEGEVFDAVKQGSVGRLRQILAADPEAVWRKDAQFGATPLHWAALKGYAPTAAFLLGARADPTAKNNAGETPLTVAQRAGWSRVSGLLAP